MTAPVLVAHRDRATSDVVRSALEEAGFETVVRAPASDLLAGMGRRRVALAIVDARAIVGERLLEVLRGVRIPVVCLAPRSGADDAASVLELGADDVLREPFSPRELVARVKAILRGYERSRTPSEVVALGPIVLDRGRRVVTVRNRRVALTRSELELLALLAESPGRVFRREELLAFVSPAGKQTTLRIIDTHMVSLRRKLGAGGEWIETIRGYGYRAKSG